MAKVLFINPVMREELRQIVTAAHERGRKVIAPRIEDAQSASLLWTIGVDYIQGDFVQQAGEGRGKPRALRLARCRQCRQRSGIQPRHVVGIRPVLGLELFRGQMLAGARRQSAQGIDRRQGGQPSKQHIDG